MKWKPYQKQRNSGVELLGQVPDHWDIRPLKRLAHVELSNVDKLTVVGEQPVRLCNYVDVYKNERIVATLPFMTASASNEQIRRLSLRRGDVIVTKDSETPDDIGIPALVDDDMDGVVCGYHLALLRPNHDQTIGGYLQRALQSSYVKAEFFCAAVGMTRYGLGKYDIENLRLPAPPKSEQDRIVAFLNCETGKLDALIAKQERLIVLLREKRRAVISHVITKGLDPTAPMKGSGVEWLGDVPAHWEVLPTKRLFQLIVDPAPKDNDFELLSIYTDVGVRPRKELEERGNKASTTDGYFRVRKGDFIVNKLLAWMGAIGLSRYDGVTSPAYDVLRAKRELDHRYFEYLWRCGICFTEFRRHSRGIMDMRLRLYFEDFGQLPMPCPPAMEQQQIVEAVRDQTSKIDALIEQSESSIQLMREHRSALISAAVTGKIDVRGHADANAAAA